MNIVNSVTAVVPTVTAPLQLPIGIQATPAPSVPDTSFADILSAGLRSVDAKIGTADALVKSFALGDSVPIHQVTAALEEARLAVEVAMQVRTRLVETYRDFMAMQI